MPLFTNVLAPPRFCSAYKPILWGWVSERSPINNVPGERAAVVQIKVADAADVTTYGPPLKVGDVFVIHGTIATGILTVGQGIILRAAANGNYDGAHHVTAIVSTNVTVIDAAPNGTDGNGTIEKFYENYRVRVDVTMENIADPVTRRLTSDTTGTFYLDVADIARRSFLDVFNQATPGTTTVNVPGDGYITQEYGLFGYDGFMVPDANGVNVYTEVAKFIGGGFFRNADMVAVNSVQPYHHIDEADQSTDLLWEDDLGAYEANINTTGAAKKRFLTYGPRGIDQTTFDFQRNLAQMVGVDDDVYLAYLWAGDVNLPLELIVSSRDAADNQIGSLAVQAITSPTNSGILAIGPRNLGGLLDPAAHHYTVGIRNEDEFLITEFFSFEVDRKCARYPRRFHWLNEFGSVDSYTCTGAESEEVNTTRATIKKDHMAVTSAGLGATGDWNERVYKTNVLRKYSITSITENRKMFRFLANGMLESADVRTHIYTYAGAYYRWTRVGMLTESQGLGFRGGRLRLDYMLGVDNRKQRT